MHLERHPFRPRILRTPGTGLLVPALLAAMTTSCSLNLGGGESPAAMLEVTETTIPELQQAMSEGRVTAVQLVDAYLARIAAYDDQGPGLNAIIGLNPAAREDAARLDEERRDRGPRGPLHGIPVILKDNYDALGMPTTGGSIALTDHRPLADAFQVRRLREAGAVILAKSNLHELAYGITTISSLGGQTRNPYDLTRNPGGSSGGTGAAVAASFAAIGWGTDTCGSIRIPASANNLFGLRVTKGLSSIDGILPLSHTQDVGGPLARSMVDLAIGLDATVGPDPADPATAGLEARSLPRFRDAARPNALRAVRIGVLLDYLGSEPDEAETNSVIRSALAEMESLGAEVVDVQIPGFDALISGTSLIDFEFKWDLMDYLARVPNPPVRSLTEIVDGELHHAAVAGVLRRSDRHESRSPPGWGEALAKRAAAVERVLAFMDENGLDALAYPSLRRVPAIIGEPSGGNNCQLSAATGFPALTVPAGFTPGGVPVGLELLARPFEDERLVSYGFAYEAASRPRRAPETTPALGGR
jgi:amidase